MDTNLFNRLFLQNLMDKENLITKVIEENRLTNRKKENPNSCPCYNGTKCHNHTDDYEMICLLCVCPEYDRSIPKGGCKINSPYGKWFDREKFGLEEIWDCTDCGIPHTEEYVRGYLEKLSMEGLNEIRKCRTIDSLWEFFDKV